MFSQFNFSGKLEKHPQYKVIFSTNMEKEEQLNNLRRELLVSYLMQETGLQSEYHALQCLVAANWNYNRARTILSENPCSDDLPRILHPTQCVLPTQQMNEHNNSQNNLQNNLQNSSQNNAQNNNNFYSQGSLKVPQPTNSPSSPSSNYNSGQQLHNFVNNKNHPAQQSSSNQNSIHNSSFHSHSSRQNETNHHQSQNSINFMASQMDQLNIRESQNM